MECVEVKYVGGYCPKTGAAILTLAKPNSNATSFTDERGNVSYQIALLNVPDTFKVKDKVFFVSYHYDADLDKPDANACNAFMAVINIKIFVSDSVSETQCKD